MGSDPPSAKETALKVAFLASVKDPGTNRLLQAAQLAAAELSNRKIHGKRLRVHRVSPGGIQLAGLTDDADVIGGLTLGGAGAIESAGLVLDESLFPVIELTDDLYETNRLRDSVFQSAAPYNWQAFRLARYFGPGDRGYRKVGFLREPGEFSDAAAVVLNEAVQKRGLQFINAPGTVPDAVRLLEADGPQAVVVEGGDAFRRQAADAFSEPVRKYGGRERIADGWRPQVAFFQGGLGLAAVAGGTVASSDYAGLIAETAVESAVKFKRAFREKYRTEPSGIEVRAYDAVRALGEAAQRAGSIDRGKILEELEGFDRVRFGHLPISLGPDDHVFAERDVLGLWAARNSGWRPLMRTFTSDLERTNVLEEDWPAFFDGTTPGGEAPFYHQAKSGITSDSTDPLN